MKVKEATSDKKDLIREEIIATFGDWIVIEREENALVVVWDLSESELGLHYGYVLFKEGNVEDWGIEKSHTDPSKTVCVKGYIEEVDSEKYLQVDGSWGYEPHYFSSKSAVIRLKVP